MDRSSVSPFELLVVVVAALAALVGGVVWLGAWTAAALSGAALHASIGDALVAATRLPSHLSLPAAAWPPASTAALPGPLVYWAATALVAVAGAALATLIVRAVMKSRVGTVPRRPLGVDARSRFATTADLRPLIVAGPQPGRFLLGRHGRRYLATEASSLGALQPRRRARRRQGDRGAVALIGPTRSGKTTAAVSGILEWHGPAVLSSVKADLLATTCGWRQGQGHVLVYDPTNTTGAASATWSPLRAAGTILGAQRAARALCEAAPRGDNVKGSLDFWLAQCEILLSGLLFVAARRVLDMARVCEWVMTQDRPREHALGAVRIALNELLDSDDAEVADATAAAARAVVSIWELEEETRSSVYATAQTVVWPWADPGVAAASATSTVDLEWLLADNNSLYLCAPIEDQQRLAPAFGGLLNDLVKQVFLKVAATGQPLDPPLLIVIDEAGNTPLRSLPAYASTLAGLGVVLVTIWQSIAQIEDAYGRQADSILTNHLSKLFYTGLSDPAAFRYLSAVLGDVEVETRSRSDAAEGRNTQQLSTTREPLVPPHMARQMRPGDALLIHGTLPPAHVRSVAWFDDRRLSARANTPSTPPRPLGASPAPGVAA